MRIFYLILIILLNFCVSDFCQAKILSGNIDKEDFLGNSSIVVDGATGKPVSAAEVSIPSGGISTRTNNNGQFRLAASLKSPAILSVKADGYKPFSITVDENSMKKPLTIVVTKLFGKETVIDSEIHHLGDDKFSSSSANAGDFNSQSEGPSFSKDFFVGNLGQNNEAVLKIGSIIGLDTKTARRLKQSRITMSSSSPTKIYLNSQKIAEIKINGDNQEIYLPKNLLKPNSYNVIKIKTGLNQNPLSSIDYDDMEFMNLLLEIK